MVPSEESEIVRRLRSGGDRALVALSGGVDSSLVASLAFEAIGERAVAVTLTGPAVSAAEADRARRIAASIGIAHVRRPVDPLAVAEYRANPSNRCFFCRRTEAIALVEEGTRFGAAAYLDGIHLDDLSDARPGIAAMDRAGFAHPLLEAGWGKARIRERAKARGLENWDEPSDACLASRVPHGEPIDLELLRRVEEAERSVRAHGFRRVRVRVRGRGAQVEVDPIELPRLLAEPLAGRVIEEVRAVGFLSVVLDPDGYHGRVATGPGR